MVIVAICNPRLDLRAAKGAGNQSLMKGVLVVVALQADRVQPREQAEAIR